MALLKDIIDSKGRVKYDEVKNFVSVTSLHDFSEQAKHPFLVGKELYDGEIRKNAARSGSSTSTMRFSAAQFRDHMKQHRVDLTSTFNLDKSPLENKDKDNSSAISHAIYHLTKKVYSPTPQNTISIGRSAENDIVIADYAISKKHAEIIIFNGMYFIMDLNSTNGVKVNHKSVAPNLKVQLPFNSTIAFGRLCFVFTHPMQLYRGMRKELLGL